MQSHIQTSKQSLQQASMHTSAQVVDQAVEPSSMQIHVITSENKALYRDVLEEHYRIRHEIYVGERRWMALEKPDGREIDQFDNETAVYLLALDGDKVLGGSRLVPTIAPHLLSDVFPNLAKIGGVPRRADIYEWTRIFVSPDCRSESGYAEAGSAVMAGLMMFALEEGIVGISVVMETYWLHRFLQMGWNCTPLGVPEVIDGSWTTATLIDVSQASVDHLCQTRQIALPQLVRSGTAMPVKNLHRRFNCLGVPLEDEPKRSVA